MELCSLSFAVEKKEVKKIPFHSKAYYKEYYAKNKEKFKANRLRWKKNNPEKVKEEKKRYAQRWRANNKDKIKTMNYANRKNLPMLDSCEFCGSSGTLHKHHPDYDYPEIYVTGCPKCHHWIHKKREGIDEGSVST